ncbi:response regulator [Brachybacterium saurashtrense]|uniref:DNA-binding response regulator n=1 Tax=Brachybacterium saurashtrense TaxID=556288 RepID=A0A345YLD2_9MICO|nr:response regulator transcription factor [Brachybacterium saurashtrense]AXK44734.1 DNA-binding response regulator [Brachybacterium saurashtrense]RRR23346.1 DNA-binding response regulator [Brachybacterium saurashtrense]
MIRVLLVDDQEILRAGLRTILEAQPQLTVVGEAGDGAAALRRLKTVAADVVLMDLDMPGMGGVEATRRLRERHGADDPRILVLTTFDQDENVLAALRAGADGFLGKGAGPAEITQGILRVAEGGRALSPSAVEALVVHASAPRALEPDETTVALFTELTPRERDVVAAIVEGHDNAEIGRRLFISPFTVKTHAHRAMMKVSARDRAQLVSLALRAGFLP